MYISRCFFVLRNGIFPWILWCRTRFFFPFQGIISNTSRETWEFLPLMVMIIFRYFFIIYIIIKYINFFGHVYSSIDGHVYIYINILLPAYFYSIFPSLPLFNVFLRKMKCDICWFLSLFILWFQLSNKIM